MHLLDTAGKIIDAMNGPAAVLKFVNASGKKYTKQSVSNWRRENHFPHKKFLKMRADLRKRGYIAPPELWGIEEIDG